MSETSSNRANNYTSEASRMLEQALEQMDGIIRGAKYELPQYFETFSLQVDRSMLYVVFNNDIIRILLHPILLHLLITSTKLSGI